MATRAPKIPGSLDSAPEAPIQETPQPMPAGLPNVVDVDPHAITSPVLTRQGWVVPAPKAKG